ncbi:hypothetical protein ABK040_007055 [Willaertia magna]
MKEYENVESIVKVWILQHEQIKTSLQNNLPNLNNLQNSLQALPLDIKYEIIYFIPTYSKTHIKDSINTNRRINNLINENNFNNYQINEIKNSMKYFLETNSSEEDKFTIDDPIITFHKMRLINKEFNLKMKLKLLNLSHLNLDVFLEREIKYSYDESRIKKKEKNKKKDEYGQLWYLLTLLRNQAFYFTYCEEDLSNDLIIENKELEKKENKLAKKMNNLLILIRSILNINHVTFYDVIEEEEDKLNINEHFRNLLGNVTNNIFVNSIDANETSAPEETNKNDQQMEVENNVEIKEMLNKMAENEVEIFKMTEEQLNQLEEQLMNIKKEKQENNHLQQSILQCTPKKKTKLSYKNKDYVYRGLPVNRYLINHIVENDDYEDEFEDNLTTSLSEYVGHNRTIKSIQLNYNLFRFSRFIGNIKLLTICLKELTTLNLINYNDERNDHLLPASASIKHINFITLYCNDIDQHLRFIPTKMLLYKNLETINIFPIINTAAPVLDDNNDEEMDVEKTFNLQTYLEQLSKDIPANTSIAFIERKLDVNEEIIHYKVENENSNRNIEVTLTFSKNFTQTDWKEFIQNYLLNVKQKPFHWIFTKTEIPLIMKKWLLEYLIINNYLLIEDLSLMEINFEKDIECKCLIQYLIYLSNEYQKSKLFNLKKAIKLRVDLRTINFIKFINYGYRFENQIIDLLYFLSQNDFPFEILHFLTENLKTYYTNNNNEENIITEIVNFISYHSYNSNDLIIGYFIQFLQKQYGTLFIKKLLTKNIINIYVDYQHNEHIEIPLIINLGTFLESYLLLELINLFTSEEILSININGNNICQMFIIVNPSIDDQFIIKIIEKYPELLFTKNNLQQTLLHTCCCPPYKRIDLAYYLIKQYNLNCDIPDEEGRTVKELIELKHHLLAKIIFGMNN